MLRTLSKRLGIGMDEAEKLMIRQQRLRDTFTQDFLNRNDHDPLLYDMLFNNERSDPDKIAETIADHVMAQL